MYDEAVDECSDDWTVWSVVYEEDTGKKKSLVWNFFSSTSSKEAECNACSKTVKVGRGTSNLRAHLKKWHKSDYDQLKNSSKSKSGKPAKTEVVDGPQGEYQEDTGKKKSSVWIFFSSTSSKEAECNLCSRTVKVAGGTSNLRAHLKKWHISAFARLKNSSKLKSDKPAKTEVVDGPQGEYQEDKGKKKSLAWNFFSSTSSKEAECKVCSRTVKVAGGTSNLRAHLRKWHISAFALLNNSSKLKSDKPAKTQVVDDPHLGEPESGELEPSKSKGVKRQTAVTEAHDRVKSFKPSGRRDAAITDAILYMVCKDGLPLSATDHEGLKFLLKTIAPLYEVPGREKLTNLLEVKHSSLRGVAEQQLTQAVWVSITADLASVTAKGCLVVTGHYIDRGRSQTVCLGVSELTPGHTGDHIANDLSRVLHSWNLETKKVCSITTDDGANIIAAVRKLMGGELNHVPCTAHLLNLCVWRALARTDLKTTVIEKVKLIVSYFCRSISASDAVRAAQRQKGVLVPLELIQGVETQWTGTFYSLERFAQLAGCVSQVLLSADHGTAPPMLSSEELAVVNDLVTVLRPFEKATKELSGDKYVTASIVLPIVNYLRRAVTKASLVSEDAAPLNEALLEQIDRQLVPLEANYLLASATVLDPRFKLIHFQLPINSTNTLQRLSQEIRALGGAPEASSSTQQSATAEDVSDESLWDLHDQLARRSTAVEIPSSSTELHPELKLYLSLATVARTECPLKFWSDQDKTFPTLARLAQKYLTVMGSSVASERIVSRLNAAASDSRERLAPAHVNMLVFMSSLERDVWFSQ